MGVKGKMEEEMVEFQLFRDNDKYKEDVFVGVNGKGYLLKRGVPLKLPKSVYEVLKNSEDQKLEVSKVIEESAFKEAE